ncbi:MAG: cysteine desulfurase family protein [Stellaceae bacterium]
MSPRATDGGSVRRTMPRAESYLDWNATAPLRPEAAAAMSEALRRWGNPSSVHRRGRAARQIVERARDAVAGLLGDVDPSGVVFVSGGTEANHLALLGAGRERVLVSAIEHDSVRYAVPAAEIIPVGPDGIVALDELDRLLGADLRPALVSVMYANNETGVIQPIAEIASIARRHGAMFHCDAVQAAGKVALEVGTIGADLITLSAHKLGGPPGVGALVVTGGVDLAPLLRGGGQEHRRRAGTENLPGIAGFAAAAAAAELAAYERVAGLRDGLEAEIAAIAPEAVVVGAAAPRLPNTSAIAMPGVAAETQVVALDLDGVMVSAGAACSSGKVGPSHVLAAMRVDPEIAVSTIRVSLGWSSSEAEIDHFLRAWTALYRRCRGLAEGARAA